VVDGDPVSRSLSKPRRSLNQALLPVKPPAILVATVMVAAVVIVPMIRPQNDKHSVAAARFHRAAGDLDPSLVPTPDQFLGLGVVLGKRRVFGAVAAQSLNLLAMDLPSTFGQFGVGRVEAALDLPDIALENQRVNVGTA